MAGSRTLRAAWRVLRRLLEAAFLPALGHKISIACSRWRRWPGARASSFTRTAAFFRCQASWAIALEPTLTRNPPSNHARNASERLARLESEELIPIPLWGTVSLRPCSFSYKIGAYANASTMIREADAVLALRFGRYLESSVEPRPTPMSSRASAHLLAGIVGSYR